MNLKKDKYNILITGGTGFIGNRLSAKLLKMQQNLTIFTRQTNLKNDKNLTYVNSLDGLNFDFDIIINLAGETISKRWSNQYKKEIYNSRILTTQNLVKKINQATKKPKVFISGSAVGVYGIDDSEVLSEESAIENQNLFSQKLCLDWESEANKVGKETRLVNLRTGIVVGEEAGILRKLITPFILGFGGKIGQGNQILSWVHISDIINLIIFAIENNKISGPLNATSPNSVDNEEFSKTLAKIIKRPCFFDMPSLVVKTIFGQMGNELLLNGQNIYPKKAIENGFKFNFENLEDAIFEELKIEV
jgi:hypothetical protein